MLACIHGHPEPHIACGPLGAGGGQCPAAERGGIQGPVSGWHRQSGDLPSAVSTRRGRQYQGGKMVNLVVRRELLSGDLFHPLPGWEHNGVFQ